MSKLWQNTLIDWKQPRTWTLALSRCLRPHLNKRGIRYLQRTGEQNICWDDPIWLDFTQKIIDTDLDRIVKIIADNLYFSMVRVYHGCRTLDAGSYHLEGIRLNDPTVLTGDLIQLVAANEGLAYLRPNIVRRIAEFDDRDRDTGKLHVALDDRTLINQAGHYLLYGSEWMQSILGFEAHRAILQWGSPTIIQAHLPLSMSCSATRTELARALLQEWTRIRVNRPKWTPERDFTFTLNVPVPAEMIVGHEHPACIRDPLHKNEKRRNDRLDCPSCRY
jgi:hypothetical protein